MFGWQHLPLLTRIRHLRYILPPVLVLLVIGYQLGIARGLPLTIAVARLSQMLYHPVSSAMMF